MFTIYTDVAMLDVLSAEPASDEPRASQQWAKIAPRGRFTTRDNRSFEINPEALVKRFVEDGIDVAVDVDHATVKKAMFGDAAPAVGWINKMEARSDGLYASIEWLSEGALVLAARTHRYLSPSLQADASGVVSWVHSVALVAAPALSMPALASAAANQPLPPQQLNTLGTDMSRILTPDILLAAFRGFNTSFQMGFDGAKSYRSVVSMETKSDTAEEAYGWFGTFPDLREWIGERHVHGLQTHGFVIKNRLFESTVAVPRTQIEDDKLGLYSPMFSEMGRKAKEHPDKLIFDLLASGFTTNCYDGQFFFDSDHAMRSPDGVTTPSMSNVQAGAGEPWFLLDCSRAVKPLVWQERLPYSFTQLNSETDPDVFWKDQYTYGVRARANAGFGLWQLAFGSKATLDATNLRAAYTAMTKFTDDRGKKLGVRPTHLVVGSENYFAARDLILQETIGGTTNTNRDLVEIIAPPQL